MSTPLIVLASILAFFALVAIPFMMVKTDQHPSRDQQKQGKKPHGKRKKR